MFSELCQKWTKDPQATCIYFAVLIVLLFLIVFYLKKVAGPAERFEAGYSKPIEWSGSIAGSGLGESQGVARALASGRRQATASEFSQPGQGDRDTLYNADVIAAASDLGYPSPTTISAGQGMNTALNAAANNVPGIPSTGGSMERLANYRYAPQFDQPFSDVLNQYQDTLPPIEYQVLDGATSGYATGASSTAAPSGSERFRMSLREINSPGLGYLA
jgi:hypothetical protein